MEIISRSDTEQLIKEAIDDYLDVDALQQILSIIAAGEDYMVVEDNDEPDYEEDG